MPPTPLCCCCDWCCCCSCCCSSSSGFIGPKLLFGAKQGGSKLSKIESQGSNFAPLGCFLAPFGHLLGMLWALFEHPQGPFGTHEIRGPPSAKLFTNFGVLRGAPGELQRTQWRPKDSQNGPGWTPKWGPKRFFGTLFVIFRSTKIKNVHFLNIENPSKISLPNETLRTPNGREKSHLGRVLPVWEDLW